MFDIDESRRICRAAIDYPEPIQDGAEFWHEGQYSGGPSQWAWFARIEQANLYAHARTALPAALDEIERLTESGKVLVKTIDKLLAEIEQLRAEIAHLKAGIREDDLHA